MFRERFLPIDSIAKSSNVILYGAGKIGRKFLQQNNMLNWCNIFMVVDTYYDIITDFPMDVDNPDRIAITNDYDYILVSVVNENAKKEILKKLYDMGISGNAIISDNNCFFEHELKDVNTRSDIADKNIGDTLRIGFLPGGVMGDNIISLKLYQELVKLAPISQIDIFTTFFVFPEIVFYGQKNLNTFIHHVPYEEDFCNYDIIIQSHFEPSLIYYNQERTEKLCPQLAHRMNVLREYQEKNIVNCSTAQYANRVQWDRAKFNGWNCYTFLGSSGAFQIEDSHVEFPLNSAFKKRFQELNLGKIYITYNYGASDPLKDGKKQTKMWPFEYHEKLNYLLKKRFPQVELIQLGASDVSCVPGADRYILGESLEVTKYVLKNSLCHFDCEGGLVHMATQLGTKCFVVFGPTPVSFFGYDSNTNFVSKKCKECCGLTKDWYTNCYKYKEAECMYSIYPEEVFMSMEKYIKEEVKDNQIFISGEKVEICMELTGGLGDYIVSRKLLDAILKIDTNINFTILGKIDYLEAVFYNMDQCIKFEKGELCDVENEEFDITIRTTHVMEIKYINTIMLEYKSVALSKFFEELMKKKETYFLYNDDQSYIDAVNLKRAKYRGLNRYTMLSHNGLIEIKDKKVNIELNENYLSDYKGLNLKKYITLNRGADARSGTNHQTKVWPIERYNELIILLKKKYPDYEIVQIGIDNNEKMQNVDVYAYNQNLEIIKYILANTLIHIDSEGGLVHLATQLGAKCAVVFGPTPMYYYGYEQNINIVSHSCKECMGVNTDWFIKCYIGDEEPRCMKSISAEEVFKGIVNYLDELEINT